ncbi:MAG: helix-turn-helix domain-containing protein [Elusimicrobiota bacterium]
MNGNGKLLTINEASKLLGVNKSTIYKYIEEDRISIESRRIRGKQIKHVKEAEITEVFNSMEFHRIPTKETERKQKNSIEFHENPQNLKESIKEVIENYFQDKETQLMRPLEEIATYKLGKVEAENQFLKDRLKTVLQENEELRGSIKALPGPPVEIVTRLEEQNRQIRDQEKEKEVLQKEKEVLKKITEEIAATKKKELEELQKKQSLKDQEIEKLKTTIKSQAEEEIDQIKKIETQKQEEEDLLATIEALKARVEEAEKKPWWKFW